MSALNMLLFSLFYCGVLFGPEMGQHTENAMVSCWGTNTWSVDMLCAARVHFFYFFVMP
jgi:hypothetical protein